MCERNPSHRVAAVHGQDNSSSFLGISSTTIFHDAQQLQQLQQWQQWQQLQQLQQPQQVQQLLQQPQADQVFFCFDHDCGGRRFSCRENYLRHLREKIGSGTTACDFCGQTFSRKSNRDRHLTQGRCKVLAEVLAETLAAAYGNHGSFSQ